MEEKTFSTRSKPRRFISDIKKAGEVARNKATHREKKPTTKSPPTGEGEENKQPLNAHRNTRCGKN